MNPLSRFSHEELKAIIRSLTSYQGSDERWAAISQTGATNEQLIAFLHLEMGIGGSSGPAPQVRVEHHNSPPRIWLYSRYSSTGERHPTLSGQELLRVARAIFGVGFPPSQSSLFDNETNP